MLDRIKARLRSNQAFYSAYQYLRNGAELLPRRIRYQMNHPSSTLSAEQQNILATLRKEGIVALPDFLSEEAIAAMKSVIDQAIKEKRYYYAAGKFAFQDPPPNLADIGRLNVIDPTYHSPEFIRFALNGFIRGIADAYIGVESTLAGIAAYRTQPTRNHPKGAFHWHFDNAYAQLKAIAYLTDVGEEDGPFAFVPGTKKFRPVSANYMDTRIADEDVPAGTYINCVGKAGTVLIVDTRIIHRATPNRSKDRDVVSVIYDAATRVRCDSFYNLPIQSAYLKGLTPDQLRFLRLPIHPGQID